MKKIIHEAKKMITAKALISAVSLGLFLPFIKLIYWVFDTSYLSGFGINPDVYSRPVFSSGFISFWLFAKSLLPIWIGWIFFSFVIFFTLLNINLGISEKPEKTAQDLNLLDSDSEWIRLKKVFPYALSKSVKWPFSMFVIGGLFILFITGAIVSASEKGLSLADVQMERYDATGECWDKFNSGNSGCFHVSGIDGADLFVIANLQDHLLYLSREAVDDKKPTVPNKEFITKLHIHEKSTNEQYTISRDYKPIKIKAESNDSDAESARSK